MSTFKFAAQPLSITKLYGQGFSLYKSAFSKVWYLILINVAIIGILQMLTYSLVPMDKAMDKTTAAAPFWMLSSSASPTTPSALPTQTATTAPNEAATSATLAMPSDADKSVSTVGLSELQTFLFGIANFIGFLIAVYFIGVILCRMHILGEGIGAANIGNPFQIVARKWFKLVMLMVIVLLLIMLGIIIFVLPGIFLGTLLAFSMLILLFEDKGIWSSIVNSCRLVWGHFWRSSIVLIPAGVVLVLGVLIQHLGYKYTSSVLVTNVIFSMFLVLFGAIVYAFLLVQYNDLRLRKQASTTK